MAGKSGRSINNVPKSPVKQMIFSWEGILVLLFIAVNIFCANFSEFYNLKSLLRQMPVYLAEIFLMLPMAYILVLGEIDISVGSIVCLSATMACIVANTGAPFIVVILATLLVGSLCGAVNAFVLTRFEELPPMIVTLATQIIFRGIAEIVLGSGGSISVTNTEGFAALGGKVGRVPYILFLVLILGIIAAVILGKCTFGRRVYAIGTNRLAAYYSGIHVQKIRFVIYTLMGTHLRTVCTVSDVFLITVQTPQPVTDLRWMPSQWQYSEVSPPQVVKVIWPAVSFPHSSSSALRVGLGQKKRSCAGYPAHHRCASDRRSCTSEHHQRDSEKSKNSKMKNP